MMIEPPCDFGRARILEINNRVFVAIEIGFVEQSSCPVQEARESEVGIFANPFAVETGKKRSRGRPVKTLVVIKDSDSQCRPQSNRNSGQAEIIRKQRISASQGKLIGLTAYGKKVKRR